KGSGDTGSIIGVDSAMVRRLVGRRGGIRVLLFERGLRRAILSLGEAGRSARQRATTAGRGQSPLRVHFPMRARLRRATPVRNSMPGSLVPNGNKSDRSDDIRAWALLGVCSTASNNTMRRATALRI